MGGTAAVAGRRDGQAGLIAADDHVVLIARRGQDAVGYLVAQRVDRVASPYLPAETFHYVHQVGVAPAARGRGAGTALLDAIEADARSRGSTRVALDHWAFNERAARFFAGRGYETYNVRRRKRLGDPSPPERPDSALRVPETFATPRLRLRPRSWAMPRPCTPMRPIRGSRDTCRSRPTVTSMTP